MGQKTETTPKPWWRRIYFDKQGALLAFVVAVLIAVREALERINEMPGN